MRILIVFGVIAVVLMAAVAFIINNPRVATGLALGVNTSPVKLELRNSYKPRETDAKTRAIVAAADRFLASLDATQTEAASYAFSDNAQRSNWSNLPEGMIPRGGLKLGTLSKEQRALLDRLFGELMSPKGALNIKYQLAAASTLPTNHLFYKYGVDHYYVAFLGKPSATLPWMFQFGGHHLGINVTVYGADITFSPMLTGGQPLNINYDGKKVFITEEETFAAQALLDSLNNDQKNRAIRSDVAIKLLLGPGEYGTVLAPEGIKGSDLTDRQKQLLVALIDARLGFINENDNAAIMKRILSELDDTYFGWWGPRGTPGFAYFRITGPSLVIEYAPQDTAEKTPASEHAHSIYRNPENDYGEDWIGVKQ